MENRCRHTRVNGARCTMPALNGRDLCYQHQERRRLAGLKRLALPEPNAAGPLVSFSFPEDHASIMANLHNIADSFANHQIDHRQAGTLIYLMNTCLKTLWQMKQLETEIAAEETVRDVTYDESGSPLAADSSPAPSVTSAQKSNNRPGLSHLPKAPQSAPLPSNTYTPPRGVSHANSREPVSAQKAADLRTRHPAKRRHRRVRADVPKGTSL